MTTMTRARSATPVIVPRLWPGSTVVCVGGGPSLTPEDVAYCQGKARVIAINDAHRLAPWADVLYSSDQRWWPFYQGVPSFTGLKFGMRPLNPPPAWQIAVLRNDGDRGMTRDPSGLRNGRNSGAAAINLAVHLGASRVVLLGYDMHATSAARSHWFGDHPIGLQQRSRYPTFRDHLATMVEPLQKLGIDVVNCSRNTALECFPRRPLREVL